MLCAQPHPHRGDDDLTRGVGYNLHRPPILNAEQPRTAGRQSHGEGATNGEHPPVLDSAWPQLLPGATGALPVDPSTADHRHLQVGEGGWGGAVIILINRIPAPRPQSRKDWTAGRVCAYRRRESSGRQGSTPAGCRGREHNTSRGLHASTTITRPKAHTEVACGSIPQDGPCQQPRRSPRDPRLPGAPRGAPRILGAAVPRRAEAPGPRAPPSPRGADPPGCRVAPGAPLGRRARERRRGPELRVARAARRRPARAPRVAPLAPGPGAEPRHAGRAPRPAEWLGPPAERGKRAGQPDVDALLRPQSRRALLAVLATGLPGAPRGPARAGPRPVNRGPSTPLAPRTGTSGTRPEQ